MQPAQVLVGVCPASTSPAPTLAAKRGRSQNQRNVVAQADKSERWRPQGGRGGGGGGRGGGGGGSRRGKTYVSESGMTLKSYVASDGQEHLGSALQKRKFKPFPGPPPNSGPPLRILPIGGLGEIGMNCMLAGVGDRYVVIDAGLMFPDFSDLGMQKILPDTDFLAQWKDRIEALIITHGHEDHIGALPWVVPALDPATPIYASSFVMQLVKRRLTEYNLWDEKRFKTFDMRQRFQAGPFEIEPVRVTHSIPDCCGLIMRSDEGTIVHTGDWKIDENPLDGEQFDRELFMALGNEPVALMMSDSTNVLSPGRTLSETVVHDSLVDKVLEHNGKGRVICTQFASNLHRLYGVKRAADAAGRKICFVGASLNHYLEAAWRDGRAPFDPKELMPTEQLRHANPNEVLIVTTGSQGEPRAQLSMAARDQSNILKTLPGDLLLYSAKVIPGNEGKVTKMLNALAGQGARIRQSRADNLHTSGHAYQEELVELLQSVRPQHFLPVHGEYAFLTEHALLAKTRAGVNFTDVIRNGEMLAVRERRNRSTVSTGSMAVAASRSAAVSEPPTMVKYEGEEPTYFFNDGGKGTGTRQEMEIDMRGTMAMEGVVVVGVDVMRRGAGEYGLGCAVRVTTRGMWTDEGKLPAQLTEAVENAVVRLSGTCSLVEVERAAIDAVKRRCIGFNQKRPEVIAIAYEHDPRDAHLAEVAEARADAAARANRARGEATDAGSSGSVLTPRRKAANPWESGAAGSSVRPASAAAAASPPAPAAAPAGPAASSRAPGVLVPGGARRTRLPAPAAPAEPAPEPEAAEPPAPAPAARKVRRSRITSAPAADSDGIIPIAGSTDDDEDDSAAGPSGGSVGANEGSTLSRMLRARKAAASTRRTRADSEEGGQSAAGAAASGPGALQPLDPKVIADRRRRNPRDRPHSMEDPDYG
ncbi:hypothetical protein HYH02_003932 [Chlamydomonas schloesseri]|uniref:Metallo-beta-lactamase domain-containing protein n=1 Tax=Chlamydomonas schloesseri TaxID=2026947 RepID=A0A836B906_9CHLO|nr:hypothetical protein HYH02_003932 [Chlamydomonas schloesseri]|eukprot:KAG2451327.1 hypothetical protein HYH02_003932 [Chlamydomonas schloesseri]